MTGESLLNNTILNKINPEITSLLATEPDTLHSYKHDFYAFLRLPKPSICSPIPTATLKYLINGPKLNKVPGEKKISFCQKCLNLFLSDGPQSLPKYLS